jgi:PadR family transcriptional regulator, regulatory protein PadR
MYSNDLLKGTLKTIVLKLLSEQEKMYGYEITSYVKEITAGKIEITEGALYPTLHKLEADGYLTTETVNIGKRVRKYYSLTENGSSQAKEKINELADFLSTMKLILNLKPNHQLCFS